MDVNDLLKNQFVSAWISKPVFNVADFEPCLKNQVARPSLKAWFAQKVKCHFGLKCL